MSFQPKSLSHSCQATSNRLTIGRHGYDPSDDPDPTLVFHRLNIIRMNDGISLRACHEALPDSEPGVTRRIVGDPDRRPRSGGSGCLRLLNVRPAYREVGNK